MKKILGTIFIIILFLLFRNSAFSTISKGEIDSAFSTIPKGKVTGITFDKALPEDISNENFPDRVDSFDFPDATLLDLVKAISKLTGLNFMLESGLEGKKISIIAPSPITVAEAYKVFLSALAANGYTLVKSGAVWKIQTVQKAHKDNTEVYSGDYFPNTDQLITRIIKLKNINAKEFEGSIKWLLSDSSKDKISTLESSNSIIVSDYGSVIERITKIINEVDIPDSKEGIKIIALKYSSADQITEVLSQLLDKSKTSHSSFMRGRRGKSTAILSPSIKSKDATGGNVKISKIIPYLRKNSLVISANKEGMKKIRELVKKLDTPLDSSRTGGVYVYNVLHGTAEDVYNTLMGIKPSEKSSTKRPPLFSRRNRRLDLYSNKSSESPLFSNTTILADSNNNSLIINAANKDDYDRVRAVLKKIDVPRDQVFIKAIIVEMIIDDRDNREINLAMALSQIFNQYFKENPTPDSSNGITWQKVLGSALAGFLNRPLGIESVQKAQLGPGLILGLPMIKLVELLGTKDLLTPPKAKDLNNLTDDDIRRQRLYEQQTAEFRKRLGLATFPLLRLLKKVSNVNVLSTPQLTTLDNVPAFLEVGENAPVGLTSTATGGSGLSQNSVERKDITLKLDIVPRINQESGTVQMDIKQKFDDFSNRSSSASELASRGVHIITRNIETKMILRDGETAVLGGLLTDKEIKTDTKVPLLGDIPLLGWLFKGSNIEKSKRNLLVFITPTIIKGTRSREKTKEILSDKLEERIDFIKKHMKGRDPHGDILKKLIPESEEILSSKKSTKQNRKWFWQKSSPEKDRNQEENTEPDTKSDIEYETEPDTKSDIEYETEPNTKSDTEYETESSETDTDSDEDWEGVHYDPEKKSTETDPLEEDSSSFTDEQPEDSGSSTDEPLQPEDYQIAVPPEEEDEDGPAIEFQDEN